MPLAAVLGTLIFHRFSLWTGLDTVQADSGDSRFIAFLLEHWNNAWHGRADWRSPPIFWPVTGTLAYSDGLLAMGAIHAALRSGLGVFAAMNAQLVLLSLASFAAAYGLFARGFGLTVWGATAGAYLFAFSWPRVAQLVHVQLQFTVLLPLLAWLALRCLRDGPALARSAFAWRACLFVALLALLLATTLYYAVFAALGGVVAVSLCMLRRGGRAHLAALLRRHVAGLSAAAVLGGMLAAPVVAFYLPVVRESQGRAWAEVLSFMPRAPNRWWMGRENWAWGWLFARGPQATIDARWPEMRIGAGLAVSLVWVAACCGSVVALIRRPPDRGTPIRLTIVTGAVLQVLMLRLPGDVSLWWAVWRAFPGASGIRGVPRLELVVLLPMALAFGWALDAALARARRHGRRWMLAAAAVTCVAAVEQLGRVHSYSGRAAEAMSRRVAEALPPRCTAAYIVATPDLVTPDEAIDEQHFDPAAYLAANPDVAAVWTDRPWDHYRLFGRAEHRTLDVTEAARRHVLRFLAYNYTIPLGATLGRVPVVNGLSGWQPPGWALFDVLAADAPARLATWLSLHGVGASGVCTVAIRLAADELLLRPAALLP